MKFIRFYLIFTRYLIIEWAQGNPNYYECTNHTSLRPSTITQVLVGRLPQLLILKLDHMDRARKGNYKDWP